MLTAVSADGVRTDPTPGAVGVCPACSAAARAKCGPLVAWHFAHVARADCDPWSEPDTDWHRRWQQAAPLERREVVIGNHRADIVTPDGWVVELQHSAIPAADIHAREHHYGRMIWLFDARAAVDGDRLLIRHDRARRDGYATFRWKHPRKSISLCRRPVYLDLGEGELLRLGRIYTGRPPHGGYGFIRPYEAFTAFLNNAQEDGAA